MTRTNFCILSYHNPSKMLEIKYCTANPIRNFTFSFPNINIQEVQEECDKYWNFVNTNCHSGNWDITKKDLRISFYDDLIAYGSALGHRLFSPNAYSTLHTIALGCEILAIVSSIPNIPWEGLFLGDRLRGNFLCDICTIVRIPTNQDQNDFEDTSEISVPSKLKSKIFISRELEKPLKTSENKHTKLLNKRNVYVATSKGKLVEDAKDCRVISILCHHEEEKGLALDEGIHYSVSDVTSYQFPKQSVLFLITCTAGTSKGSCVSIASAIANRCGCTVIAASCILPQDFGYYFLDLIEKKLSALKTPSCSVYDLWIDIIKHNKKRKKYSQPHPNKIIPIVFSIYGDIGLQLKGD